MRKEPMNNRRALVFTLTILFLLAAGAAQAQWTVGFNVGSAEVSGSDSNLEFRSDARGGYSFHTKFGVEAEVLHARGVLNDDLDAVLVNGIFELGRERAFSPYVLLGIGAARVSDQGLFDIDFHGDRYDSKEGAAFQAAVGARYYFGRARTVGLRLELSTLVENTDVFDDDQHTSLSAGMTWRFGG